VQPANFKQHKRALQQPEFDSTLKDPASAALHILVVFVSGLCLECLNDLALILPLLPVLPNKQPTLTTHHIPAGQKLRWFTARHLANMLRAFVKLGHHPGHPGQGIESKLQGFNTQNLANTLWALATLGQCAAARSLAC
jgi:hypothetical protein